MGLKSGEDGDKLRTLAPQDSIIGTIDANTVLSAAMRLGKHRTTIQRWLSSYPCGRNGKIIISETPFGKTKNNELRNYREIIKGSARARRIQ
jgi:hypothetical protein